MPTLEHTNIYKIKLTNEDKEKLEKYIKSKEIELNRKIYEIINHKFGTEMNNKDLLDYIYVMLISFIESLEIKGGQDVVN